MTIDFVDGEYATAFTIAAPTATATPEPTKQPASGNGDVNIPKTGDTSSMTPWYVVMFACIAVGIATVILSKKRKYNR